MKYQTIVRKVPGDGLIIHVCVSHDAIEIYPSSRFGEKLDNGAKYRYRAAVNFYKFVPEAYKAFWREYEKSYDFKYNGARMREALNYALKIYRKCYGEIFA